MSEQPKQQKKVAAQQRLATALRDNLKRRKAQERARNQGTKDQESGSGNRVSGSVPKKPNS